MLAELEGRHLRSIPSRAALHARARPQVAREAWRPPRDAV